MRILSDWQTGKPPMPGMWLTQLDKWQPVVLMQWDGQDWINNSGIRLCPRKWRGLAFDPSKAEAIYQIVIDDHKTARIPGYFVRVSR